MRPFVLDKFILKTILLSHVWNEILPVSSVSKGKEMLLYAYISYFEIWRKEILQEPEFDRVFSVFQNTQHHYPNDYLIIVTPKLKHLPEKSFIQMTRSDRKYINCIID